MFKFQRIYFILALLLFIVEVVIALFIDDAFIRPYVGDFLVVILMYCFVRSFFNTSPKTAATVVLLFAYFIEVLQYFKIVKLLGLQQSLLANVVIGNSFSWSDMLAYTLAALFIVVEKKVMKSLPGKPLRR